MAADHGNVPEPVDVADPQPVRSSRVVYSGLVWDVRRDEVDLGEGGVVERDVVDHPGAVGIVALDDRDRIALVQQYRHPIGMREWEIPAGLLDVDGEPAQLAAARELAEEADLIAGQWNVLISYATSPGFTNEQFRIFLARDLSDVAQGERHQRTGEEHGMPLAWLDLDDAFEAVLAGRFRNVHTVAAVLAAHAARARGWRDLRAADAPWQEHPANR